jgi:DNA-binding transcriptional LysR family regulator
MSLSKSTREPVSLDILAEFLSLAKTSNMTVLARASGASKAGISRRMRRLEEALGVQLIIRRKRRGVLFTTEGIVVAAEIGDPLQALLLSIERLQEKLGRKGSTGLGGDTPYSLSATPSEF